MSAVTGVLTSISAKTTGILPTLASKFTSGSTFLLEQLPILAECSLLSFSLSLNNLTPLFFIENTIYYGKFFRGDWTIYIEAGIGEEIPHMP
jgi:hypothetical protein